MFARVSSRVARSAVSQSVRGNSTRNVNAAVKAKQQKYYADVNDPTPIMFREAGDKVRFGFSLALIAGGAIFILKGWWNMANGTGKIGRG